jgi:hypothetical protein
MGRHVCLGGHALAAVVLSSNGMLSSDAGMACHHEARSTFLIWEFENLRPFLYLSLNFFFF